jgi:DnaJ-class molecular chaperone
MNDCPEGEKECPRCEGTGEVPVDPRRPLLKKKCPKCGGSGCVDADETTEEEYYAI